MINKILSIFFQKKPQSKKYFTVMREKQNEIIIENKEQNCVDKIYLEKQNTIDFNNRGKIYNVLFNACNQR